MSLKADLVQVVQVERKHFPCGSRGEGSIFAAIFKIKIRAPFGASGPLWRNQALQSTVLGKHTSTHTQIKAINKISSQPNVFQRAVLNEFLEVGCSEL